MILDTWRAQAQIYCQNLPLIVNVLCSIWYAWLINLKKIKNAWLEEHSNETFTLHATTEFLHVKPGKGAAFVRTKMKNYISGNTVEKTFRAGSTVIWAETHFSESET
jgi:hypothetical protein